MPQTTNTQESTDPIARLESDMLRFVPSRGWEIKVVTFPETPDSDVVIPHGLTVDTPEAIHYQVLQTNCPQSIYHLPTSAWTHSEIRLRSTVASGQAVILLTTSKTASSKLNLWQQGDVRIATGRYGWFFTATSGRIEGDRATYTITGDAAAITIGGSQTKIPVGNGSVTLAYAASAAGSIFYGNAGLTFGTNTSSVLHNRFFAHQLSLQTITATITANQNDYSPTGWPTASTLLIDASGANRTLTGLSSTAAYTNWSKTGRAVWVQNNSATYTLTLNHAHVSSSAENRFNLPYGEDIVLGPGEGVNLIHNGSNWGLFDKGHTFAKAIAPKAGIQFPAVQVASTDANVLDDYEEGTWTPVLRLGGLTTGITYSSQEGISVKIGRNVFFTGVIALSSKGTATGAATLAGLPGSNTAFRFVNFFAFGLAAGSYNIGAYVSSGATPIIELYNQITGSAVAITDADLTNSSTLYFSGWYQVAD